MVKSEVKLNKDIKIFDDPFIHHFIEGLNPKLRQWLELLSLKDSFKRDFLKLQKKWKVLIEKNEKITKELEELMRGCPQIFGENYYQLLEQLRIFGERGMYDRGYCYLQDLILYYKKETYKGFDIGRFFELKNDYDEIKYTPQLQKDVLSLIKKYYISPVDICFQILLSRICKDPFPFLIFSDYFLLPRLSSKQFSNLPEDANFEMGLGEHPHTKEKRVELYLNDDCSYQDIKKYFKYVKSRLGVVKSWKGQKKRYYPLKNLEIARRLNKLDKKYESDWIKQEKIYGEIGDLNFGKKEQKRKNKIKQIRYQYKKRFKS